MSKGIILSLCDYTGRMVEPWLAGGYDAIIVDPQHAETTSETTVHGTTLTRVAAIIDDEECWRHIRANLSRIVFVAGFPPCTDLAVSGSRWFESKRVNDETFQFKAMQVVWQCYDIARLAGCPFLIENPVSRISTLWRKPDWNFDPYQFTALCPDDNYTKLTCLWTGNGYAQPPEECLPEVLQAIEIVEAEHGRMVAKKVALKAQPDNELVARWYPDNRIHDCPPGDERANFRSATPGGFAQAVFAANAPHFRQQEPHAEARNQTHHRAPGAGAHLPVSGADHHRSGSLAADRVITGDDRLRSFLKWAGGKYDVLDAVAAHMPAGARLIEPFVGAGSIFLNFRYDAYLLADINGDLINLYRQLQMFPNDVSRIAEKLVADCASEAAYMAIRDEFNGRQADAVRHAALFLALNRTCFNGLCRFNQKGGFNVGWNKKVAPYFPLPELTFWRGRSATHTFACAHFSETIAQAGAGDVVFCDPPYEPMPDTSGFVSYGKDGFDFDEQVLLASALAAAHGRGARIVVTNSSAPRIMELYLSHGFSINRLEARRSINRDGSGRKKVIDIIATL